MKNRIEEYLKACGPKSFSRKIKNDPECWEWVLQRTSNITDAISISERIYLALYKKPTCPHGNDRKFKSFIDGYIFCGRAGSCQCARESVSNSVSKTVSQFTENQKKEIQAKREDTSLRLHGTRNNGQTKKARQRHKEYFSDQNNVRNLIEKSRNTFQMKYGPYVTNAAHLSKHRKRMTSNNPMKNKKSVEKAQETKKEKYNENYYKRKSYERIQELLAERKIELLVSVDAYNGVNEKYDFKCLECNYSWNQVLYRTTAVECKNCNPTQYTFKSGEEDEVRNFLKSLGITVIQRNQSLIGTQLDLICPDHKIAIEYCGLYYHSELEKPNATSRDSKYHIDKLEKTEAIGWRLITIFSDEWKLKREIVENFLRHVFKVNKQKIYARNTIVKEIDWKETKDFLDTYHLQGKSQGSKYNLGLYHNNDLVAVMTFSNLRKALNSKKLDNSYELVRFVTNGTSVIGGASKLFKYFIRKYNPEQIVSYADRRWSQGNLYKTLGFEFDHFSPPSYWYTFDHEVRYHRFNFRKQKLVEMGYDKNKTEWEIMRYDLGYDRIWDCGTMKFIWKKKDSGN